MSNKSRLCESCVGGCSIFDEVATVQACTYYQPAIVPSKPIERNIISIEPYNKDVMRTAPKPEEMGDAAFLAWASLGLCEAGEVQNEIKKVVYQDAPYNHEKLIDELGDLFYYMTALMVNRGITLSEVISYNMEKRKNFIPGKGRGTK